MSGDNRFCFVAPMYDASKYVGKMLASIISQSYENWRVILIDDVSSSHEQIDSNKIIFAYQELLGHLGQDSSKIQVFWNSDNERKKQWEVSNVLYGISMCDDNDIICRIDADDWLTDTDALYAINQVYKKHEPEVLWTMHRWAFSNKQISGPMPNDVDPYKHPWVSSHLKTFRKRIINGVKDENFRGPDGEYIKRAGDQAIYLPCLANTSRRFFLPMVTYHYTIKDVPETYQTNDAKFQRDEAVFLRQRGYIK